MRGLLIEGSTVRPILPDWHELLAAFCGHIGDQPENHPVTRAALALALLHNARLAAPEYSTVIDCGRAELIADIDEWIDQNVSPISSSEQCTGAAVDEMAEAQVHANHLLRTAENVSDERVHQAWFQLAALADRWTDLVAATLHGQPLPPSTEATAPQPRQADEVRREDPCRTPHRSMESCYSGAAGAGCARPTPATST